MDAEPTKRHQGGRFPLDGNVLVNGLTDGQDISSISYVQIDTSGQRLARLESLEFNLKKNAPRS